MKTLNDFLKEPGTTKLLSILDLDHDTMTYLFEIALEENLTIPEVIRKLLTNSQKAYEITKLIKELI